jgi:hypothetical protein
MSRHLQSIGSIRPPLAAFVPSAGLWPGLPGVVAVGLALLFCVPAAWATDLVPASEPLGPPLTELSRLPVTAEAYPAEDAVILYRGVEVTILPDGRMSRRVRLVQRLLRDLAVTQNGDPAVAYDTLREELTIHQCRTLMRDGREVGARRRAFNRVTPERSASCPDRAELQETVISHLGLELGCLTELDYTLSDRARHRPWCEGMEEIGSKYPVLRGEVLIRAPEGTTCRTALGPAAAGLRVEEQSAEGRHGFSWGPLPGYPDEGGMGPWDRQPFLVFSTCTSWDALYSWIDQRIREEATADSAIQRWCRGPMANHRLALDDAERLSQLAWLLGERTEHSDDARTDWWRPVRPASRVFSTSCADLLDRAALAEACLKTWSMEGNLVLHPALGHVIREVPSLSQFSDLWLRSGPAILSVGEGREDFRPEPGWAEELLEGPQGGCRFLPLPARTGSGSLVLTIHQQPDGSVSGEAVLAMGQAFCQGLELADIKGFLQKLTVGIAAHGEVTSYRLRALAPDTCSVVFAFTGPGLGDSLSAGRRRLFLPSLPGMPQALLSGNVNLRREARSEPLLLRCCGREEVRLRLELGEGVGSPILPAADTLRAAGAVFERSSRRDGRAVILERRFDTTRRLISPAEYPGFRELWGRRVDGPPNTILLEVAE